jgi:hypothetical protein
MFFENQRKGSRIAILEDELAHERIQRYELLRKFYRLENQLNKLGKLCGVEAVFRPEEVVWNPLAK